MSILYKKVWRLLNPLDKKSAKKVYPVITYKYGVAMDLKQIAKKISRLSGVSEGVVNSVLKDFRTELKEELLLGRSVNIDGLGFFYLAARSKGADTAEAFTANDITGFCGFFPGHQRLRVCFRANKEIRITANGSTRSEGLSLKDVDRINDELPTEGGGPSSPDGGIVENPLG